MSNYTDSTGQTTELEKPATGKSKLRDRALTAIENESPEKAQHVAFSFAGSISHAPGIVSIHENLGRPSDPSHVDKSATSSEAAALTFPRSGYIGVAAKFAELYSQHYESPKEFIYVDLLGVLGTILSGRVRADFDLPVQPRLYVLKVAESAWRRKSTSTRFAEKFVRSIFQERLFGQYEDYASLVVYGVGSAEGLGTRLKSEADSAGNSVTTRRAVLVFDEFRRFEAKSSIDGSALRPMVNELFESNQYENLTKTTSLRIPDGHLGFLSNTTEATYRNLVAAGESIDLGFLNRFFLVVGRSTKKIARPQAPPESELAPIREELKGYLEKLPPLNPNGSASDEKVIHLTAGAEAAWADWYQNLEETAETARLDNLGMRLMGLLAFTSGNDSIDEELLWSVLDILKYQEEVRRIYQPITGENADAKMEQRILRELRQRGPLSERDLRRYANGDRAGLEIFRRAKNMLIHAKEIRARKDDDKLELRPFAEGK